MVLPRFVDAHVHLWDLKHLRYGWLTPPFSDEGPNGSVEAIAQDYGVTDYFTDAAGFRVDKIVHVDAGAHPDDSVAETEWLQANAFETGFPTAIVAFAALDRPDVETQLARQAEFSRVRGIRQILNWHTNPRLTYTPENLLESGAFAAGYAALAKHSLSFDLQIYPNQMAAAYTLAKANPDVPVIINHMGMPVEPGVDGRALWKSGMAQLASLPHVAVKISGFGFIARPWTVDMMRSLVLDTISLFGTQRCLFASDFPTDKLFNTYSQALNAYDQITKDFSATEREAMFAANAERIYRI